MSKRERERAIRVAMIEDKSKTMLRVLLKVVSEDYQKVWNKTYNYNV